MRSAKEFWDEAKQKLSIGEREKDFLPVRPKAVFPSSFS
jgi:hypothetical protein